MFDRLLRNVVIGFIVLLIVMSAVALWKEKQVPDVEKNIPPIPSVFVSADCEPCPESTLYYQDGALLGDRCNYREACKTMGYCEEFCYLHYCQENSYYKDKLHETQLLLKDCNLLLPLEIETDPDVLPVSL